MLGLEDLVLANTIVRRRLADPNDVRAALAELDRLPARGDLCGRLAARAGCPLARPDVREATVASVRRHLLARSEGAVAARLKAAGVPAAVVDALAARQQQESFAWSLAQRLSAEGRIPAERAAAIAGESARELRALDAQIVLRHRQGGFAETIRVAGADPRTRDYSKLPLGASTDSALAAFAPAPAAAGPPTPAAPPPEEAVELTVRLPAFSAGAPAPSGDPDDVGCATIKLAPTELAVPSRPAVATALAGPAPSDLGGATLKLGPDDLAGTHERAEPAPDEDSVKTVNLAPPPPPSSGKKGPLSPGAVVAGKYEVVSVLGRGGMGVVYRARARDRGGQDVALKAVPLGAVATEAAQRFKREILTATLVEHENVCAVYDAGEADGVSFMAMELIEGEMLKDLVKREAPLEVPRALDLIGQVVRGVQACHTASVVHRDLKPENVRITRTGSGETAKIVDFGIARLVGQDAVIADRVFVTMRGKLSGTPAYVAPELIDDPELVDRRCDLYACGVILYELLTGALPFQGKTLTEILKESLESPPRPLAEAAPGREFPRGVERLLFKLLEKDPLVRYQSAEETLDALAETLVAGANEPERRPRPGFTGKLVRAITRLFGRPSGE